MKGSGIRLRRGSGSTLIEAVLAIAMLAAVLPLIGLAMVKANAGAAASEVESLSLWMLPSHLQEFRESIDGHGDGGSALRVWAHGAGGECLGELQESEYKEGVEEVNGKAVRCLVVVRAVGTSANGGAPLLRVRLSVEQPASWSSDRRKHLDFYTCIRP